MFRSDWINDFWKPLWWSFQGYRVLLIVSIIVGFVARGLLLATGSLFAQWAKFSMTSQGIVWLGIGLNSHRDFVITALVLVVGGFILTAFFRLIFSDINALMISRLHDEALAYVVRYPMEFFLTQPVGKIVSLFASDYANAFRMFGGPLAEFLSIIFDLIWLFLWLGWVTPWLIPLTLLTWLAYGTVYLLMRQKLEDDRKITSLKRAVSIAHIIESVQGHLMIRISGQKASFMDRFQSKENDFLKAKKQTFTHITGFNFWLNVIGWLLIVILLTWGFKVLSQDPGSTSIWMLGVSLAFYQTYLIQMFFEWLAQFQEAAVGFQKLAQLLWNPIEPYALLPDICFFPTSNWKFSQKIKSQWPLKLEFKNSDKIILDGVSYRYPKSQKESIKDVFLELPPGRYAIVGKTGSGKTTFVNILSGLLELSSGCVKIGSFERCKNSSQELKQNYPIDALRAAIHLICQDPIVITGSLKDNIDPANRLSQEQFFKLLNDLQYQPWIENPECFIEENGRNLSSGEKQLIQWARVLSDPKPILIFDEPTSHLDPKLEKRIQQWLNSISFRWLFVIAHKWRTIEDINTWIWIHQGQIKAVGWADQIKALIDLTDSD